MGCVTPDGGIQGNKGRFAIRPQLFKKLIWDEARVAHIARHNVTPEEVEEACAGLPLKLKTKSQGKSPVYNVLGRTVVGRYLSCFIIQFADGNGWVITAREMTRAEKRRYQQWRNHQ